MLGELVPLPAACAHCCDLLDLLVGVEEQLVTPDLLLQLLQLLGQAHWKGSMEKNPSFSAGGLCHHSSLCSERQMWAPVHSQGFHFVLAWSVVFAPLR